MRNPLENIDIDKLIYEAEQFPQPDKRELGSNDALYFTDPFISDRNTLSALLLLFDRVFVFYNFHEYISRPLQEGQVDFNNSAAPLIELLQKRVEELNAQANVSDIFSPDLAVVAQTKSILRFHKEIMPLRKEGIVFSLNAEAFPRDAIKDRWDALQHVITHAKVQKGLMEQHPELKQLIPPGKAYIDEPLFLFHRMFSAMWGLNIALGKGITPVTDNHLLLNMALNSYEQFNLDPNGIGSSIRDDDFYLSSIVSMTALNALKAFVPALGSMEHEDILELRERTKEERNEFLNMVRSLVETHREVLMGERLKLQEAINKLVAEEITPVAKRLSEKIEMERESLSDKRAKRFAVVAPGLALLAQAPIFSSSSLAIALLGYGITWATDIREHDRKVRQLKLEPDAQAVSFLLSSSKACISTAKGIEVANRSYHGLDPLIVDWNNSR